MATNAEIMEKLKYLNEVLAKLDKKVTELENGHGELITCPVCKGNVSNKANSCPHCGHPIQEYLKQIELMTCPECGERVGKNEIYCSNCEYPVINIRPHSITLREFIGGDEYIYLSDSYDVDYANLFVYEAYGDVMVGGYECSFNVRSEESRTFYLKCNYAEDDIIYCESKDFQEETLTMTLSDYDEWYFGAEIIYEIGYLDETGKRKKLLKGYMQIDVDEIDSETVEYEIKREKIKTSLFVNDEDDCGKLFAYDFDSQDLLEEEDDNYSGHSYNISNDEFDPSSWDDESYLRSKGYTVSQTEGLSDYQRSKILEEVLQSGVMSKYDIISHLERMINLRKNMPQYSIAISKWERDIEFVRNCKI